MSIEFEWDDEKARSNLAKHGVDFVDAAQVFRGPIVVSVDRRQDYGEERVRAIGEHSGRVFVVIFTPRNRVLRLISAWKAGTNDRKLYDARIAARSRRPDRPDAS